jgi:hypothetical protein
MKLFAVVFTCSVLCGMPAVAAEPRSLFNGKNLEGWETFLGPPHASVKGLPLAKNDRGEYLEPVGAGKDPTRVYTVVQQDGAPVIRISGEINGALISREEFENYHLRLEMKWGERKWPPRENEVRDSGVLYHSVGPQGGVLGSWMQSFELQIQEHDTGDFLCVGDGVIVDVEGDQREASPFVTFRPAGPLHRGWRRRVIRNPRSEKPLGQWNTVELFVHGQTAVHVCNGKTNTIMTGLRRLVGKQEVPATKGKIQIQSEGAEVFYRNISLTPIEQIPRSVLQ